MLGVRVGSVSTKVEHSLALDSAGRVYAWGDGSIGKLGHGDKSDQPTPRPVSALSLTVTKEIAAGRWHSAIVTSEGVLFT
jgi:alpha-tubulin suppressor-like RCC1 family protein